MRPVRQRWPAAPARTYTSAIAVGTCLVLGPALPDAGQARPGVSIQSQSPDSAAIRMAPSGLGPRTLRLSTQVRSASTMRRDAGDAAQRATQTAPARESWIDVPCELLPREKSDARRWLPTTTLARVVEPPLRLRSAGGER
jgi:hypothetical protein